MMETITGKTVGILERLPHFYHAAEAGGLLAAWVDIFGRRLERAEADLYRVLRAHHVETADNEGFQGYTAPPEKRGDLDKIFALYLEALGGTALLVKVNPRFTMRSLNARRLAQRLVEDDSPLLAYLRPKFRLKTWKLLLRYDASRMQFSPADVRPGLALALLLGRSGSIRYIRDKLTPETRKLLEAYNGGARIDPRLQIALAKDLNERLLRDPALFRKNEAELRSLNLPPTAVKLINSIYLDYLREKYSQEPTPDRRQQLLNSLQNVEPAEVPVGDDLVRLNRLLLEAVFPYPQHPWGIRPRGVPHLDEIREALVGRGDSPEQVGELNLLLEDPELYAPARFPDLAEDYPYLKKRYESERAWLNRILLESAFPNEIERGYAPYRERLRGLINVLRRGASTRRGIVDIVAANLGIVGDDPQVWAAKALINVEEFAPERTHFFEGRVRLFEEFEVNNTNPGEEAPEIWLKMLPGEIKTLCHIRFTDLDTFTTIRLATCIEPGDTLVFKENTALLNGVTPPELPVGVAPLLKPGWSRWRFEADLICPEDQASHPAGRFDENNFDEGVWASTDPVATVEVMSYRYTPGTFTVVIPWHIPGFTDKFAETDQHPRHQILTLVNRVKAAGIEARVAYKQVFSEDHNQLEAFGLQINGGLLVEKLDMRDSLTASNTQQAREDQNILDSLSLSGRFDTTSFDSLNTFAR
ncbi:MAG: hypothetical protein L6R45_17015 [Anaerolineae bacterium]|nr:hypothetical protein [Anaerolineae bacterium]